MKVADLEFTPIFIPYKEPYHWAQGITEGAQLILVKLTTDKGIEGYGESIATPSSNALCSAAVSAALPTRAPILLAILAVKSPEYVFCRDAI